MAQAVYLMESALLVNRHRWKTLEHRGVAFPPEHVQRGIGITVFGERFLLNRDQEELIYAWAKKKDTHYVKDIVFQSNFLSDLKKLLPEKLKSVTKIEDIDLQEAYSLVEKEVRIKEEEKEKLKKDTSNMFSNISRAITKYSYGTSKITYSRLEKIGSRPWEIFDEDIMPYLQLLQGIRQELISGKMTLKDSSRTIEHIDQIMNSLENISSEIKEKNDLLSQLRSSGAGQIQSKLWQIEKEITNKIEFVSNRNHEIAEARKAMEIRSIETKKLVRQIEEEILEITDNKYSIKKPYS